MAEQFSGLVEIQDGASTTTVSLNGDNADVSIGGSGQDGDILLYRSSGDPSNTNTATVHIDGEGGDIRMGGSGADGDRSRG